MKKRDILELIIALVLTAALYILQNQQKVRRELDYFWSEGYYYIVYALLIIGILAVLFRLLGRLTDPGQLERVNSILLRYMRYPYFIVFLPLAFLPVFRCYFKVPYIFCRVCPKPCPWGAVRNITVPAFLAINLDSRLWCYRMCPIGTLQDCQCKASKKKFCLPGWAAWIRYAFLAFTIAVSAMVYLNLRDIKLGFFYIGIYHAVLGVTISATAIFLLSFFIPRFWCNYFCPIGSFSDIVLKIERWIERLFKRNRTQE